jgi:hypothetical protein
MERRGFIKDGRMINGRLLIAAGILSVIVGCQPPPQQRNEPPRAATNPSAESKEEAAEHAAALARRTSNYAEELKQPTAQAPTPQPSDVKFVDSSPSAPAHAPAPATAPSTPTSQPAVSAPAAPPPPATQVAIAVPTPAPASQPAPVIAAPTGDALDRQIAKRLKDNPLDVAAHLDQQMLMLLRDQSVPDLSSLAMLPSDDRETISALMDCLANYRSGAQNGDNIVLTKKVRPLLDLADRIRTRADLAVPVVEFCSEVTAFGRYTPMVAAFIAKQDHPAIIYCEVENFSSRLDDQHEWKTSLTQSMQVYNDHGISVWQDPQHTVVDSSRTRRHDFFLARRIRIPALPAGRYTLKVTITDSQAQRLAEGTQSMELTAE